MYINIIIPMQHFCMFLNLFYILYLKVRQYKHNVAQFDISVGFLIIISSNIYFLGNV